MNIGMSNIRQFLGVFIGSLFGLALLTSPAQAKTLTYSIYTSPTSPGVKALEKGFNYVKKETNGDLTFDLYAGGTLTNGKTTLSGIKNGVVDGGTLVSAYTPSALPVNAMFSDLLFYNDDVRVAAAAMADTVLNDCPACIAEFKKNNVHTLSSVATSPYRMMCKGKFENGFDPEGLRMRAGVSETGRWIKAIGGIPVDLAQTEAYQALQRNALDCSLGVQAWLHTYSWSEIVDSVVKLPVGGYMGGSQLNVSQTVWDDLDSKTRNVLRKAGMYVTSALTYEYLRKDKSAAEEARKKYHVKFIDAPESLKNEVKPFKDQEVKLAIEKARSKGVKNPKAIVDAFIKNIKKWKGLIGDKDLTEDQYAQLLIDNVLKNSGN